MAVSRLLYVIVIAVSPFALYWLALGHDFLINWDDNKYVTDNPVIRGITPEHLKEALTPVFVGNYASLHIVSYMLDYELWGLKPAGFLLANILFHTANGLLFYLILTMLAPRRWSPQTGRCASRRRNCRCEGNYPDGGRSQ